MNFKEYWERNKVLFEAVGVTKEIAAKIWSDAVDAALNSVTIDYLKRIRQG